MNFSDIDCRYTNIIGFDDYYITECGDVYSTRLRGNEKEPHVHKLKPKDPGRKDKYLNIILCTDKGQATKSIHRLVAEHFVDGYFDGAVVNHKDGNNRNNHYLNLEWVSQKENVHKSYVTSKLNQTRNYLWWNLFDNNGTLIGTFKGHDELERFVKESDIKASASSLTKYGISNGYKVVKKTESELH